MTDKVKLQIEALRWAHSHHDCSDGKMECPVKNECFHSDCNLCDLHAAADIIESFAAELEQVKQERDGLSIMLTSATSAGETYKRERDAIVKMFRDKCEYCKHFHVTYNGCTPDCDCDEIECKYVDGHWTGWEWIGVKE